MSPTYPTNPRELKFPYSPSARYDVYHGPYLQTARIGEPLSYASGYAEARLEPERAPISFLNELNGIHIIFSLFAPLHTIRAASSWVGTRPSGVR